MRLSAVAAAMIKARCEEDAQLAEQIAEREARRVRLKSEIEELFIKEGQGEAFMDGCDVEGYKIKLVCGESSTLDKIGLMKKHGLVQADLDEFTNKTPNKPYTKITAPKGKK